MARWSNFEIWRGRLPHWRADDVTYYVTFRYRRDLTLDECVMTLNALTKPDGRKWDLLVACVLPTGTELMFKVREAPDGRPYELSEIVEKVKQRVGKQIIKRSGERFPPFYSESYDRIVRDEIEIEQRWTEIVESSVAAELANEPDEYPALWVADAP